MKEALTNKIINDLHSQNKFLFVDNQDMTEYAVSISNNLYNFCVGLVDLVNSTRITAGMPQRKVNAYYEFFLNYMAKVLKKFGGAVIKNVGDSLLFYYPESCYSNRKYGFTSCLESALAIVDEHIKINEIMKEQSLPQMDYRISLDHGNVSIMKTNDSSIDLIGSPVNMCSKINRQAPVNGIVVGGDLYQLTKGLKDYYFKKGEDFSLCFKQSYPIYYLRRKNN